MDHITLAYNEYAIIVEKVAEDYSDETQIIDLRKDHPELDFMDDDEIQQILDYAKGRRISKSEEECIMTKYKITFNGDESIRNVHHIGIEYNGTYFSVIFGNYINGGFFSIPNMNVGGELGSFSDRFWNEGSISRALKNESAAKQIALAIAEYGGNNNDTKN